MVEIPQQFISSIIITNGVILLILIIWIFLLQRKTKKMLMSGTEDIGGSLKETKSGIENLRKFEKEITEYLKNIEKRVSRSVQSVETVRFTPFGGGSAGGNQSFSTSFVNEEGDGIVVSGLYYSRDRVSIFTKPIKGFISEFDLTDEEKEALEKGKISLKK